MNDQRLRKLLRSLPKVAIKILHDQYYHTLLRTSANYCNSRQVAEEIVQEVLLHVWKESKALAEHHQHTLIAYMLKIVRNKSVSYYRSRVVQLKNLNQYLRTEYVEFSNDGPDFRLVQDESLQEIRRAVDGFPKRERQCLLLKIDEGMTTSKIAEHLNVSIKAVEHRLTSARKRLRKHLQKVEKNTWIGIGKMVPFSSSD